MSRSGATEVTGMVRGLRALPLVLVLAGWLGGATALAQSTAPPPGAVPGAAPAAPAPGPAPVAAPLTALVEQLLDLFPKISGEVVEVRGDSLTLDAGRKNGVQSGLELEVFRQG